MFKRIFSIVMILGVFALAFGSAAPSRAQEGGPPVEAIVTLARVADIFLGASSSSPSHLAAYNGALYFGANGNDGAGNELWKYDPANGAARVADIYTGSTSSSPNYLTVYNNALYFNATGDGGAGIELWKYDPINGAQIAADINISLFSTAIPNLKLVMEGR